MAKQTTAISFLSQIPSKGAVYLITSKGGGGHLQAANALEKELYNKKIPCFRVDILEGHFLPGWMGRFLTKMWDQAKKEGNKKKLRQFANGSFWGIPCRKGVDILFYPPVFISLATRLIRNRKICALIDTQPLCTRAIVAATLFAAKVTGRSISIYKVLTDFPTKECVHFAEAIRSLSPSMRKALTLVSTKPLSKPGESEEAFWQNVFSLSKEQVYYDAFPLRRAFRKPSFSPPLRVRVSSPEESELLLSLFPQGKREKNSFHLPTLPASPWGIISLGSQADQTTTLLYLKGLLQKGKKPLTLFVLCGKKEQGLYEKVAAISRKEKIHRVVPLSFQSDEELAPLFHFADFGIYGTGGITLQEVYTTASGKIFMHTDEEPIIWEEGNSLWMEHFCQAKRVDTNTFKSKELSSD